MSHMRHVSVHRSKRDYIGVLLNEEVWFSVCQLESLDQLKGRILIASWTHRSASSCVVQ